MAKQRHLANAPITEALIDLRVTPRDGFTFAELKSAVDSFDTGYYVKSPISEGKFEFTLAPDGQPSTATESAQVGLRLHSNDEKYVAQFSIAGFTLSRLPPYETWENLLEETRRLWSVYVESLAPLRVVRIATRYINNLNLPLETGESFQTYLHKLVDVPAEAPQVVETFFQRFQLVETASASSARVILTLALDGIPLAGRIPVILDIDAFVGATLSPTDRELWLILERLRELKNRTFFGIITEHAAELYE
jgi:uncharacterized protein (TIGR04255 family)